MNFLKEFRKAISSQEYTMKSNFFETVSIPLNEFDYDKIPDDMKEYFEDFEKYLIMGGCLAVGKINGKLTFVRGGLGGGELNEYGYPTRFIGATGNGTAVDWAVGTECVVFWNNKSHSGDMDVLRTTDLLTDIDTSIDYNILYSRFYPVPLARDEKEKIQIANVFDNLKKGGKTTTVLNRKESISDLMNGTPEQQIPILNLTDVSNADKIQYLSRLREDVKRWFLVRHGHDLQGSSKMAQQSVEEINGNNSVSFIYPLEKFEMRKRAVDEMNALFGTEMVVSFSPAWLIEYEKFVRDSIGPEEIPEDPSEELPEESNPEDKTEETPEDKTEETPEDKTEEDNKNDDQEDKES